MKGRKAEISLIDLFFPKRGTDGGSLTRSWGQSQINLTMLGVVPGDNIRLRYDMDMDGCTGNDGWYVDNVSVRACNAKKEP